MMLQQQIQQFTLQTEKKKFTSVVFFLAHIFSDHVIIPVNNETEFTANRFLQESLTIIMLIHQLKIPWNI